MNGILARSRFAAQAFQASPGDASNWAAGPHSLFSSFIRGAPAECRVNACKRQQRRPGSQVDVAILIRRYNTTGCELRANSAIACLLYRPDWK